METPEYILALRLVGGSLALDFGNTAEGTPEGDIERGHLFGYQDLAFWGHRVGLLSGEDVERLLQKCHERPVEADAVFARALEFRGHLYELYRAVAEGHAPPEEDVEALRRFECEALSRAKLVPSGDGFAWQWAAGDDLSGVLWPVAHAATALLTSGPLGRVENCAGCKWLLLDESKKSSRPWCSMGEGGTHAKMRRYVARRAAKRKS